LTEFTSGGVGVYSRGGLVGSAPKCHQGSTPGGVGVYSRGGGVYSRGGRGLLQGGLGLLQGGFGDLVQKSPKSYDVFTPGGVCAHRSFK
jgi:hypothetical protein